MTVGTVAAADGGLDYSVIKFDLAKVTPVASFAGFAINGIGTDADWHQPVCKRGAATGDDCRNSKYIPRLVGLIRDGYVIPGDINGAAPVPETHLALFSAIMGDVNAKGGPCAGFSPIPA
jgi:hypothetical protein